MGSNHYSEEQPIHIVKVFSCEMGIYQITQGQYKAIIGSNPSFHKLGDNYPVEQVSWFDAIKFCNALSAKAGLDKCYYLESLIETTWVCDFKKNGFRLPTEAEWEYACRGGLRYEYGTDDGNIGNNKARYESNKPVKVGTYPPNPFGLYDMSGNIDEWCNDWHESYSSRNSTNPTGPNKGSYRVIRGGSWYDNYQRCRSDYRYYYTPDFKSYFLGFRIVRRP
jgi:formylglycine-generating enzyme required for sulfatase activity